MNFFKLFLMGILLVDLIGGGLLLAYNYKWEESIIENQVVSHMENILDSKEQRMIFNLEEKKGDAIFLSELKELRSFFSNRVENENNLLDMELKRSLQEFKGFKNYNDLILMDFNGEFIWSVENIYDEKLLKSVYEKIKENLQVNILEIEDIEGDDIFLFVTAPVVEEDNLIGLVILVLTYDDISNLLVEQLGFEGYSDIYVVGEEGVLIGNLKYLDNIKEDFDSKDYFQKFYNFCLSDENVSRSFNFYKNYAGINVLGLSEKIDGHDWCLVLEIDEKYFMNTFDFRKKIVFRMIIIENIIILFAALVLDGFFRIKRRRKK